MTVGQVRVRCCDASGCRSVGSRTLLQALEGAREHLGLTPDDLRFSPWAACAGVGRAPWWLRRVPMGRWPCTAS